MKCRVCNGANLHKFLSLGFTPLSDRFLTEQQLNEPEVYYPLDVYLCDQCSLVQLGYVVPPEAMFNEEYPYESSTTRTGREHFGNLAEVITQRFGLESSDLVVDIGSNVGVLLGAFKSQDIRVLGVEPSRNIAKIARERGIDTIDEFFSKTVAEKIIKESGKAKVITGTNVFAHVNDLDGLLQAVDLLLEEKGIFVIEVPYLVNLIDMLEYDTIYHEHLSYFSLKPLIFLFKRFGMEVFDVERIGIHGGSIRVFVRRSSDCGKSNNVEELLLLEEKMGLYRLDTYKRFVKKVEKNREDLVKLLRNLKNRGKKIVGVSAPAKGNTLLNYCKIDCEYLDYIVEKARLKIGLYTPGTHIPVLPESKIFEDKPDYALLLAWNFRDEITKNLKEYVDSGGKFIIPIPEPCII